MTSNSTLQLSKTPGNFTLLRVLQSAFSISRGIYAKSISEGYSIFPAYLYFFSFPPRLKSSKPSVETFFTSVFPETMSVTVAKIEDQSSKIVNGTFSFTQ